MALTNKITAIADGFRQSRGTTEKLSLDEMAVLASEPVGGGDASGDDVIFIDYDGTVLYSYSTAGAEALTELPPLPEHDGLICQGWNFDLETIKSCNKPVTIGAMYTTDDGKTRIYIHLEEERKSPILGCCPNGTVTVDWGDGSTPDVLTGNSLTSVKWTNNHEYSEAGDYVITLTVDGSMSFYGESVPGAGILRYSSSDNRINIAYQNSVQKIEIGDGVVDLLNNSFNGCYSMKSISIPNTIISIGRSAFSECNLLRAIVIPNGITDIIESTFAECYSLDLISIPNSITNIGNYAFNKCYSLESIFIPTSVTSIGLSAFYYCGSLKTIFIPNGITSIHHSTFNGCHSLDSIFIPNSVTSIGKEVFRQCYSLESISIPNSVTSVGRSAFYECASLESISIPNGGIADTDTSYLFYYCKSLRTVILPNNLGNIGDYFFQGGRTLLSIVIPTSVTRIGSRAFCYCYGLKYVDFSNHTSVPTLTNTDAFTDIANDCEIRVPASLYDEWISATNWSTLASKIVAV